MFSTQMPRFVNRNVKQSACGDAAGSNWNPHAIKTNLICRTSAERVRNRWGTSAEGQFEKDRIKKKNMPESKDNFIVHGLSGTFAGIGTFHKRGGKTFLRKIRAKPSVPDSKQQVAVKKRFAEYIQYAKAAIKDPDIKAAYSAANDKALSISLLTVVFESFSHISFGFLLDLYRISERNPKETQKKSNRNIKQI